MKKMLAAALFLALSTAAALAADFNGKWTADVPSRQGGTMTTTFTLAVADGKVTGSMGSQMGDAPISNGKVDGDNISFDVVREFNDNKITLSYAGKAQADGTIQFTRTISGFPGGGDGQAPPPQTFTAKKAAN
jgi:opacity protein-like surface antigen